ADILAAGPLYGGPRQRVAVCYLFNAGTGSVAIESNQIFREGVSASLPVLDLCGPRLAPNTSCVIQANITNTATHSCKFVISPSASDVRGVFELRAGGGVNDTLQSTPLR